MRFVSLPYFTSHIVFAHISYTSWNTSAFICYNSFPPKPCTPQTKLGTSIRLAQPYVCKAGEKSYIHTHHKYLNDLHNILYRVVHIHTHRNTRGSKPQVSECVESYLWGAGFSPKARWMWFRVRGWLCLILSATFQ